MELNAGPIGFLLGIGVTVALALSLVAASGNRERREKFRQRDRARTDRREQAARAQRPGRVRAADQDDQDGWEGPAEALRESHLHIPPADVQKIEAVAPRNDGVQVPGGRF